MTTFDLGIEGATVVTARERRRANVYVSGGRIAAVSDGREPAREVVDAGGLLLLPGMVDTHVHLMDPAETEREDFPTGTAAAARAGVTTIVEHTHAGPVRRPEDLVEKREYLRDRSRVDFGLAAHAWPDMLEQVEPLWREGVTFFKAFTCTTHGVPGLDDVRLRDLFERVAALGATCLVHSEDETLTAEAERALRAAGRDDGGVIPEWRSREAELTALERVTGIARETGARVVLAHVSHREALDVVARERDLGARVLAECCPQYLTLLEDEVREHGALRKFTPPARARTQDDLRAMWTALVDGTIHHVSTDHAPSTRAQKASGSIWEAPFGLPGLDTTLPVLLDGAALGLLSYERVAEAYAEAPARAYGLFPRKGGVAVGSDADLVLVDPTEHWTVRDDDVISKAGWSPLAGRRLTGRAIGTYLRGTLVASGDEAVAEPGVGEYLPGAGTARDG